VHDVDPLAFHRVGFFQHIHHDEGGQLPGSLGNHNNFSLGKINFITLISPVVDWKFIDLKIVENPQKCLKLGE
jgi:hypothetical protein